MIDVSLQLERSVVGKADWSSERAVGLAHQVASQLGGAVDWDVAAGEEWIRVLSEDRILALVSTVLPFGFMVDEPSGRRISAQSAFLFVAVPDMSEQILVCTEDALRAAFGERTMTSFAFDAHMFSAEELWFATVS